MNSRYGRGGMLPSLIIGLSGAFGDSLGPSGPIEYGRALSAQAPSATRKKNRKKVRKFEKVPTRFEAALMERAEAKRERKAAVLMQNHARQVAGMAR